MFDIAIFYNHHAYDNFKLLSYDETKLHRLKLILHRGFVDQLQCLFVFLILCFLTATIILCMCMCMCMCIYISLFFYIFITWSMNRVDQCRIVQKVKLAAGEINVSTQKKGFMRSFCFHILYQIKFQFIERFTLFD